MTCSKYADVIERFRFGLKYVCNVVEQPLSEILDLARSFAFMVAS